MLFVRQNHGRNSTTHPWTNSIMKTWPHFNCQTRDSHSSAPGLNLHANIQQPVWQGLSTLMGHGVQKAYWPWYSLNEPDQGYRIKFCEERRAAHQVTCVCEISFPKSFTSQNHVTCIEKAVWSESAKLMNLWASSCGSHKVQWLPDYSDLVCYEDAQASVYLIYLLLLYRFDYLLGISCNTGRLERGLSRRDWEVVGFLWTRSASFDTYIQPPTKVKNAAPKALLASSGVMNVVTSGEVWLGICQNQILFIYIKWKLLLL